jgi:putative intracellular protease/amidase
MKTRTCYLFVFDGYADWEPSLVIAALQEYTDFEIKTFSETGDPVRSMGNIKIQPELSLHDLEKDGAPLLILPGGNKWEQGGNSEVEPLITYFIENKKTVGALCAATGFMASRGFLNNIRHTSNGLEYVRKLNKALNGAYTGEHLYVNEPCVADGNIITANGAAMIEFTSKILDHFNLMDPAQREFFHRLYKNAGILQETYKM